MVIDIYAVPPDATTLNMVPEVSVVPLSDRAAHEPVDPHVAHIIPIVGLPIASAYWLEAVEYTVIGEPVVVVLPLVASDLQTPSAPTW